LHVVDFGGAFGINYFQNQRFLKESLSISWQIVEQEKFVKIGKQHFETGELRFSKGEEDISAFQNVNCLIFSGVLQYLENPYHILGSWIAKGIPFILIDRTTFIKGPVQRLTLQTIPANDSQKSFPCWLFNTSEFLTKFADQYELIADFPGHGEQSSFLEDGTAFEWKGFLFQRRK
jgi:putative methyltransferase (TIGR04325 family)